MESAVFDPGFFDPPNHFLYKTPDREVITPDREERDASTGGRRRNAEKASACCEAITEVGRRTAEKASAHDGTVGEERRFEADNENRQRAYDAHAPVESGVKKVLLYPCAWWDPITLKSH